VCKEKVEMVRKEALFCLSFLSSWLLCLLMVVGFFFPFASFVLPTLMPPFRSICGGQLMGLIRHTPVC
jgi:hypothetical protein